MSEEEQMERASEEQGLAERAQVEQEREEAARDATGSSDGPFLHGMRWDTAEGSDRLLLQYTDGSSRYISGDQARRWLAEVSGTEPL